MSFPTILVVGLVPSSYFCSRNVLKYMMGSWSWLTDNLGFRKSWGLIARCRGVWSGLLVFGSKFWPRHIFQIRSVFPKSIPFTTEVRIHLTFLSTRHSVNLLLVTQVRVLPPTLLAFGPVFPTIVIENIIAFLNLWLPIHSHLSYLWMVASGLPNLRSNLSPSYQLVGPLLMFLLTFFLSHSDHPV